MLQFFPERPSLKIQNLQYIFLDWNMTLPPSLELFRNSSVLVPLPVPFQRSKCLGRFCKRWCICCLKKGLKCRFRPSKIEVSLLTVSWTCKDFWIIKVFWIIQAYHSCKRLLDHQIFLDHRDLRINENLWIIKELDFVTKLMWIRLKYTEVQSINEKTLLRFLRTIWLPSSILDPIS